MNTAFDYVDRLFNGLVYFILNLVESIVSLYKNPVRERWSRLSEQIFRVDKWSVCHG